MDPELNTEPDEKESCMNLNPTSMAYWLPRIKELPIPMPQTILVNVEYGEGMDYLSKEIHRAVELAAETLGYPVFIRTDLCSGKHEYLETCFVKSKKTLHRNLERLRDDNFCKDLYFGFIAVREFLDLDWKFKAFRGLPIAPERRYFINEGKVVCRHPYWPEDSIEFYNIKSRADLPIEERFAMRRELVEEKKKKCLPLLQEMNTETENEVTLLTGYAELVAGILPEYWSVDFAKGRDGTWYLIDMAQGDRSYHDDDCPVRKQMDGLS